MGTSRIFIGNLNPHIKEKHLKDKFSYYGNIASIEIKNKLDIEGEPISKFAYITLKAKQAQINECICALDGSVLKGSVIKVEIARESFLERLKREREQNAFAKSNNAFQKMYNNSKNHSFNTDLFLNKENPFQGQYNGHYSYTSYDKITSPDRKKARTDLDYETPSLEEEHYNQQNAQYDGVKGNDFEKDRKSRVLNQVRTCPAFTRNEPTASDNLENKNKKKSPSRPKNKKIKKFVRISSDLHFEDKSSSGFSLLAVLGRPEEVEDLTDSRVKANEHEDDSRFGRNKSDTLEQQTHPSSSSANYAPYRKSRFFIQSSDPDLQVAVDWLTRPLTDEMRAEFQNIRPFLVDWYKHRKGQAQRASRRQFQEVEKEKC